MHPNQDKTAEGLSPITIESMRRDAKALNSSVTLPHVRALSASRYKGMRRVPEPSILTQAVTLIKYTLFAAGCAMLMVAAFLAR